MNVSNSRSCSSVPDYQDWADVVKRVQIGDSAAMEELYDLLSRGPFRAIRRRLGSQDAFDKTHDVFVTMVDAIQQGKLREPKRLLGFARVVARRMSTRHLSAGSRHRRVGEDIGDNSRIQDQGKPPDIVFEDLQNRKIIQETLRALPERQREILIRFYIHEHSPEKICSEMQLTSTQFRLLKSRAKARFALVGRRFTSACPVRRYL
jgi:RNA polymerase sigma-70 factor (ECF subfamily)